MPTDFGRARADERGAPMHRHDKPPELKAASGVGTTPEARAALHYMGLADEAANTVHLDSRTGRLPDTEEGLWVRRQGDELTWDLHSRQEPATGIPASEAVDPYAVYRDDGSAIVHHGEDNPAGNPIWSKEYPDTGEEQIEID